MKLEKLKILSTFKNLKGLQIDFQNKNGVTVLIGNNGSGKSNILEAVSAIFRGLFDKSFKPGFSYVLNYDLNGNQVEIEYKTTIEDLRVKVNGKKDRIRDEYLPNQVICCYSGEEDRIWKEYYKPVYDDYVLALKGKEIPELPLIFINKYYWHIALLTFFIHDFEVFRDLKDFCIDTLGISSLDEIIFEFDVKLLEEWPQNPVVNFVRTINPDRKKRESYTLDELKELLEHLISSEIDFFKYLMAATMPKEDKLIKSVTLSFNDGQTVKSLSEGEKKLILIQLILEVLGDENSLMLFDESDSHVHISRKKELKNIFSGYENRENILTTHSPTLTHSFPNKNIEMLVSEGGESRIKEIDKLQLIERLTEGHFTVFDANLGLTTTRDILLVEGKTDYKYLSKALNLLGYTEFEFVIFPCGGANNVVQVLKEVFINHLKDEQLCICLFDEDDQGIGGKKGVDEIVNESGTTNIKSIYHKKTPGWTDSFFVLEDYFPVSYYKPFFEEKINNASKYSHVSKIRDAKKVIETNFDDGENNTIENFEGFRFLIDELLRIQREFHSN